MGTEEGGNAVNRRVILKEVNNKFKRYNKNRDHRNFDTDQKGRVQKKAKFQWECEDFMGDVVKAGSLWENQIAFYIATMEHIKTYVEQKYDHLIWCSKQKKQDVSISEPVVVPTPGRKMTEIKKISFTRN